MTMLQLTHHVLLRMNARRISAEAFHIAMQYGRKIYTDGSLYYFLGRNELNRMSWLTPDDREHWEGITIVSDPKNSVVLTCFKNKNFTRRIRGRK